MTVTETHGYAQQDSDSGSDSDSVDDEPPQQAQFSYRGVASAQSVPLADTESDEKDADPSISTVCGFCGEGSGARAKVTCQECEQTYRELYANIYGYACERYKCTHIDVYKHM